MLSFPALPVSPELPVMITPRTNTLQSESEAGYKQTRPRFTRQSCEIGPVVYQVLLESEKTAIQDHFKSHGCTVIFTYTPPGETSPRNVRYKDPGPAFGLVGPNVWTAEFKLEEV